MSTKVKLINVRLFFNDLFTPVPYKPGDKPRYGGTFGILKTDKKQTALVESAIQAEATEAWKTKSETTLKAIRGNSNKFCTKDGDAVNWQGGEGCLVLTAHRKATDGRPYVINQKKVIIAEDSGVIYSGCYVNCTVEIWAQAKGEGSPGMRCSLLAVQKCGDGDSFSGAGKANPDDFDELEEGADAEELA